MKIDEARGITGKKIQAKTIKNKAYTPLLEVDLIFNHSTGLFDVPLTIYETLKEQKRLTTGRTNEMNLNADVLDTNEEHIVKFNRKDWDQIYEQHKDRIYEVLK